MSPKGFTDTVSSGSSQSPRRMDTLYITLIWGCSALVTSITHNLVCSWRASSIKRPTISLITTVLEGRSRVGYRLPRALLGGVCGVFEVARRVAFRFQVVDRCTQGRAVRIFAVTG